MLLALVFIIDIGRYHLQSNPLVNLHQRLLYEARFGEAPPPAALSADDAAKWKTIVADYKKFIGKRHPLFDAELIRMNSALSQSDGKALPDSIPPAAAAVLKTAMPLYKAQWEIDDRSNRFWMAIAQTLLASAGEELADAHAKAYGRPFPKRIRVDVTSFGAEFGAYTVGEGDAVHSVISSTDPGTQGFGALESLMHEPSHAVVDLNNGAIGPEITKAAKELGVKPPYNLWHAILFYTSGELTRRALDRRGVHDYKPFITNMYAGPFRGQQQALETHWQAYLDGKETREAAIRAIVSETAER